MKRDECIKEDVRSIRVAPRVSRPYRNGTCFFYTVSGINAGNFTDGGVDMAVYKAPKGTKDVLPEQSYQWQYLEALIRSIVKKYGFLEARTPVIEHTELFLPGVGEKTDIGTKEM